MSSEYAIRVRHLGKSYQVYQRPGDRLKQFVWRGRAASIASSGRSGT